MELRHTPQIKQANDRSAHFQGVLIEASHSTTIDDIKDFRRGDNEAEVEASLIVFRIATANKEGLVLP